jgi:hypothetical protein
MRRVRETEPEALLMPTEFVGRNGVEIHEVTPVTVTGCPRAAVGRNDVKRERRGAEA